jgi:hypothetical protein
VFIPVAFHSVNSSADLKPGRYSVACSSYGRIESGFIAVLFHFSPAGGGQAVVVDLLLMEGDGTLRARDFLWLPDRSWRDSDGLRADRLDALLPVELLSLQLSRKAALGEIQVGEPQ